MEKGGGRERERGEEDVTTEGGVPMEGGLGEWWKQREEGVELWP